MLRVIYRTKNNKKIFRDYFIKNFNKNLNLASPSFISYCPGFEDTYPKWTICPKENQLLIIVIYE